MGQDGGDGEGGFDGGDGHGRRVSVFSFQLKKKLTCADAHTIVRLRSLTNKLFALLLCAITLIQRK